MTCQRGEVQTHQFDCFQDEGLERKKESYFRLDICASDYTIFFCHL